MGVEVDMSLLTLCIVVFSAISKHACAGSDAVFNTHAKYEVDVKAAAPVTRGSHTRACKPARQVHDTAGRAQPPSSCDGAAAMS